MNNILVLLGGAVCLAIVQAQVYSGGDCPKVPTQSTFDINRYMGYWYELYRFYSSFETGETCIHADYQLQPNGHVKVTNIGLKDGKDYNVTGDAYVPEPDSDPAKMKVKFGALAPYANYWILETDYDNYAFVYSCNDVLHISKLEFAWIITRSKTLSDDLKKTLFNKAKAYGLDVSNFKLQNLAGCPNLP